jgi:hypothetical protein
MGALDDNPIRSPVKGTVLFLSVKGRTFLSEHF